MGATESEFDRVLREISSEMRAVGIDHCVGGSVASSRHGVFRATADIDLVVAADVDAVRRLCRNIGDRFYADQRSAEDAIRTGGSFNLIDLSTGIKVDCFPAAGDPFRLEQLRRAERDAQGIPFATREDSVLAKLRWYRAGGEASEVQWRDLMGLMGAPSAPTGSWDFEYLARWAETLGVGDLLDRLRRAVDGPR